MLVFRARLVMVEANDEVRVVALDNLERFKIKI